MSRPSTSTRGPAPRPGAAARARHRRLRRLRVIAAIAVMAFAGGAVLGSLRSSGAPQLAAGFAGDWAHERYGRMYADISPAVRTEMSERAFARAYERANTTATVMAMKVTGRPRSGGKGILTVPVQVRTRLFGTLRSRFRLPIEEGSEGPRVTWSESLAFPGLRPGETLRRHMRLPPRASLLARDGSVLASGPASGAGERYSPLGTYATAVVGSLGRIPTRERSQVEAEGVPDRAFVGVSGLELALDRRLRGMPGGALMAGERVLASAAPKAGKAVHTSISPRVQEAAVTALGETYGGIIALQPKTGQLLAVAGIGLESVQPPGSTFKMVTVTGALQAGVTSLGSSYPAETHATLDGVKLWNDGGESCGGTLEEAFAKSCNSVFAPLGVKVGAKRLVATAERYGFNEPPAIHGAVESTLPKASEIEGELALGSTAIGQGQVDASALEMATIAATVADGGTRPRVTATLASRDGSQHRVTSPGIAREVRRLMLDVVSSGTGQAAAIPGVEVAGKTGTAELKTAVECNGEEGQSCTKKQEEEAASPENTDAWFAAFAPAKDPKIAVAVLLVKDGSGGETAAPIAREVLEAGLQAHV